MTEWMAEPTDNEALRASRTDPRAFVAIFERHFDAVNRYLRRRVQADLADDLTAETFVRAFQHRRRYRAERDDARPWLYGIATNLAREHLRREQREFGAFARTLIDPAGEVALPDRAGGAIAGALASLNDGERDVLFLYAWAELDYEEIAEALAIPGGTVRSRLHRARGKLRELLADERPFPGDSNEVEEAERNG
jgi:RNA polymerase sigma factor (sigma-70 family)